MRPANNIYKNIFIQKFIDKIFKIIQVMHCLIYLIFGN